MTIVFLSYNTFSIDLFRNSFGKKNICFRYTGYKDEHSWRIWRAIYEENCFKPTKENEVKLTKPLKFLRTFMAIFLRDWRFQRNSFIGSNTRWKHLRKRSLLNIFYCGNFNVAFQDIPYSESQFHNDKLKEMCLEKRAFFRAVSGLHTSITIHLTSRW